MCMSMHDHDKVMIQQMTDVVDRYAVASHVGLAGPLNTFVSAVAPQPGELLLDACCGPGNLTASFAPHVREYVGIDFTPAMLQKATARAAAGGLTNTRFEHHDALALDYPTGSFDVVVNRFTLHHMPDPAAALCEWARVLKPGGRLGIFDMFTSEHPEERELHDTVERLRDPSHVRTLALSDLFHMIGLAGLGSDSLAVVHHEFDVDDWMMHCEQTEQLRRECYALFESSLDTSTYVGKRIRRDERGKLFYRVRWAITVATKPSDRTAH
jgi:ubiquinone/menaquinone biosynthesis C-methylase UbiE